MSICIFNTHLKIAFGVGQSHCKFGEVWRQVLRVSHSKFRSIWIKSCVIFKMGAEQSSPKSPSLKIYQAIANGKTTKLQILLNTYHVNVISNNLSALHHAAWNNHQDAAIKLLELGANVNANAGSNYVTPLDWAVRAGNVDMGKFLIQNGANITLGALYDAIQKANLAFVNLLVSSGANINTKYGDWKTPLHQAVIVGNKAIVQTLIENGANIKEKDKEGKTPFDHAKSWKTKDLNIYNQIIIPLNQKSRQMALENQLDEANVAKGILQSKVVQHEQKIAKLENELESAKRREKTNYVEELNSRKKFVHFVQESLMPYGTELKKHLDQLDAKIESIGKVSDLKDFNVKVTDLDYDKLKLDAFFHNATMDMEELQKIYKTPEYHANCNIDVREKSIDIIKKIRMMFPNRTDEDIFKDIKDVKEKNGNTLKNISADHIVDQIIETINNEGMRFD